MHVIVVGCGRLGSELAVSLDRDGHSVSLIDKNKAAFQRYLPERFSGRAVLGVSYDREVLEQAGIKDAGGLAATTGGDNTNILTARIAKETYQVPNVVARIQDPRRAVIYQRLGIPTVAVVAWAADQVKRRLFPEQSVTEWTDGTGTLHLVERAIPDAWAGKKLAGLGEHGGYRLVAVARGGVAKMATPELVGQEGDILYLAVTEGHTDDLEHRLTEGADH